MITKQCVLCLGTAPLESFHRNKNSRDGRENRCRACRSELARRYREQHRDTLVSQTRRYQERNREYFREYNRRYRAERKRTVDTTLTEG